MRDILPGFHRPTEDKFRSIWSNCIFIFDTSTILNIYRFESEARKEFLELLESIQDRLWIPFHVALEFQRNRPGIIAEQKRKFTDVRKALDKSLKYLEGELNQLNLKKRHSLIYTDGLLRSIRQVTTSFLTELSAAEKEQIDVHDADPLRLRIETLFQGRIGKQPSIQWMDSLMRAGAERYRLRLPPGFLDVPKDKDSNSVFSYGGVTYEKKFGDLIIWKQILDHSSSLTDIHAIFVTDDEKEDWWWSINTGGEKKLGPRPELIEEGIRVGGMQSFYIYNSEKFLEFSKLFLNSAVSPSTIEQARDNVILGEDDFMAGHKVEIHYNAILNWLEYNYANFTTDVNDEDFPDFIVCLDGGESRIGVEWVLYTTITDAIAKINLSIKETDKIADKIRVDEYKLIVLLRGKDDLTAEHVTQIRSATNHRPDKFSIIFGFIDLITPYRFVFRELDYSL